MAGAGDNEDGLVNISGVVGRLTAAKLQSPKQQKLFALFNINASNFGFKLVKVLYPVMILGELLMYPFKCKSL